MWHLGTWFCGGLAVLGLWLDAMMLRVFSNLNDSVIIIVAVIWFLLLNALRKKK